MDKIIGIIKPFDINQTFYIYKGGQQKEIIQTTIDEIPDIIFKIKQQYEINQIDISGPQQYTKGIVNKIQKQEMLKYNENNLKFNYI